MYFNYHAKAVRLIREDHLTHFEIVEKWNAIAPALVLYFDNDRPMPIREEKWAAYFDLIDQMEDERRQKQEEALYCGREIR